jgi:hypothetical protein
MFCHKRTVFRRVVAFSFVAVRRPTWTRRMRLLAAACLGGPSPRAVSRPSLQMPRRPGGSSACFGPSRCTKRSMAKTLQRRMRMRPHHTPAISRDPGGKEGWAGGPPDSILRGLGRWEPLRDSTRDGPGGREPHREVAVGVHGGATGRWRGGSPQQSPGWREAPRGRSW